MISPRALDGLLTDTRFTWPASNTRLVLRAMVQGASLLEAFNAVGLGADMESALAQVANRSLDLMAQGAGAYDDDLMSGPLSRRAIAAASSFTQTSLAQIAQVKEPQLRRAIQLYQRGQATADQVAKLLPVRQVESLINTGMAGVQRLAAREFSSRISDSGETLYLYTGPDDQIARPYCAALAGLVVEETRLANTPNGHGLSPLMYCGGWNCRHTLIPVNSNMIAEQQLKRATAADYMAAKAGAAVQRRVA